MAEEGEGEGRGRRSRSGACSGYVLIPGSKFIALPTDRSSRSTPIPEKKELACNHYYAFCNLVETIGTIILSTDTLWSRSPTTEPLLC